MSKDSKGSKEKTVLKKYEAFGATGDAFRIGNGKIYREVYVWTADGISGSSTVSLTIEEANKALSILQDAIKQASLSEKKIDKIEKKREEDLKDFIASFKKNDKD